MQKKYTLPDSDLEAFNCPHCEVYAYQKDQRCYINDPMIYKDMASRKMKKQPKYYMIDDMQLRLCDHCNRYSIWIHEEMVYPSLSIAPLPSDDMPDDVKEDFIEARKVIEISPRASAALLRLALQKLLQHLGEGGKNIDSDIGELVKKGLKLKIQKALDSVRVIGNEAVHPGVLDLKDNKEIAIMLFKLLNIIIYEMITEPKEIDELYNGLPQLKLDGIKNRDNNV